jgi:predicted DNA-binding protein
VQSVHNVFPKKVDRWDFRGARAELANRSFNRAFSLHFNAILILLLHIHKIYCINSISIVMRCTMSTQMIVRIDPELKAKVNNLAKSEGKNISEVVRELLEDYIKNRDIGLYIDDLWKRIGAKLESRGFGPKDINRMIQEVRTKT